MSVHSPEVAGDHSRSNGVAARHSSETNEHYTPAEIVEAARRTLGDIDLDPASSIVANERVKAANYYDSASNGFGREWCGRVFLNPPGGKCSPEGRELVQAKKVLGDDAKGFVYADTLEPCEQPAQSSAKAWWFKLAKEYAAGRATSAIFVGFSLEILQVTQVESIGAIPLDFDLCFPKTRVGYMKPDGSRGTSPPHASVIVHLPADEAGSLRFKKEFSPLGRVLIAGAGR